MRTASWCWLLLCLVALGCSVPRRFHCQTELHADGSVDRAILQEARHSPDGLLEKGLWQEVVEHHSDFSEELDSGVDIRKLPRAAPPPPPKDDEPRDANQPNYFAAWNRFPEVAALPNHYEKKVEELDRSTRFERQFEKRDFGFCVDYYWRETLTEIISLPDALAARRELAKLICDLVEFSLKEGLGPDYDASEFVTWTRTEGTQWFEELCESYLQTALHPDFRRGQDFDGLFDEVVAPPLMEVNRKYGLDAKLVVRGDGKELEKALKAFVADLVRRKIKRVDGQPLEEHVIQAISSLGDFESDDKDKGEEEDKKPDPVREQWRKLEAAGDRFIETYPGGKKEYQALTERLSLRINGVHGGILGVFADPTPFSFQLRMPGEVVNTNGKFQKDGSLHWSFVGAQAFPLGYHMEARSIESRPVEIAGLSPTFRANRERWVKLADVVGSDTRLRHALRRSAESRSLAPLEAHQKAAHESSSAERRAAEALRLLTEE